jgi:hypothetical protein
MAPKKKKSDRQRIIDDYTAAASNDPKYRIDVRKIQNVYKENFNTDPVSLPLDGSLYLLETPEDAIKRYAELETRTGLSRARLFGLTDSDIRPLIELLATKEPSTRISYELTQALSRKLGTEAFEIVHLTGEDLGSKISESLRDVTDKVSMRTFFTAIGLQVGTEIKAVITMSSVRDEPETVHVSAFATDGSIPAALCVLLHAALTLAMQGLFLTDKRLSPALTIESKNKEQAELLLGISQAWEGGSFFPESKKSKNVWKWRGVESSEPTDTHLEVRAHFGIYP